MSKKQIIELALLAATVVLAITKAIAEKENVPELISFPKVGSEHDRSV